MRVHNQTETYVLGLLKFDNSFDISIKQFRISVKVKNAKPNTQPSVMS